MTINYVGNDCVCVWCVLCCVCGVCGVCVLLITNLITYIHHTVISKNNNISD